MSGSSHVCWKVCGMVKGLVEAATAEEAARVQERKRCGLSVLKTKEEEGWNKGAE